jgi:hypothetical protein
MHFIEELSAVNVAQELLSNPVMNPIACVVRVNDNNVRGSSACGRFSLP